MSMQPDSEAPLFGAYIYETMGEKWVVIIRKPNTVDITQKFKTEAEARAFVGKLKQ